MINTEAVIISVQDPGYSPRLWVILGSIVAGFLVLWLVLFLLSLIPFSRNSRRVLRKLGRVCGYTLIPVAFISAMYAGIFSGMNYRTSVKDALVVEIEKTLDYSHVNILSEGSELVNGASVFTAVSPSNEIISGITIPQGDLSWQVHITDSPVIVK